jgi:hypothetical protein
MNKPLEIKGSLLAHNTLFNLIGQGLPLVVAVVTIPFIIQRLGMEVIIYKRWLRKEFYK